MPRALRKTIFPFVPVILGLLTLGCSQKPLPATVGAGSSDIIGGGGDYEKKINSILGGLRVSLQDLIAGEEPELLCSGVSDLTPDQIELAGGLILTHSAALLNNLSRFSISVAPGALQYRGESVKALMHSSGGQLRAEIISSAFDSGEAAWLAVHELIHSVASYIDSSPFANFFGQNPTRQALDASGRCLEAYFVARSRPAVRKSTLGNMVLASTNGQPASLVWGSKTLPDGKFIVLESHIVDPSAPGPFADAQCIVRRYLSNGTLDATFGNGGTFTTVYDAVRPEANGRYCYSLELQSDGKILIGGVNFVEGFYSRAYVLRLTVNGVADSTFANGGEFLHSMSDNPAETWGQGSGVVSAMHAVSDGALLVGGRHLQGNGKFEPVVLKLNSNGTLNSQFNGGRQLVLLQATSSSTVMVSVRVSSAGKVLALYEGLPENSALRRFVVTQVDGASGAIERTVLSPFTDSNISAVDLVLSPDGKFYVLGRSAQAGDGGAWLARFTSAGELDFKTNFQFGRGDHWPRTMVLTPSSKLLVGGTYLESQTEARAFMAQLDLSGNMDVEFKGAVGTAAGAGLHSFPLNGSPLIRSNSRVGGVEVLSNGSIQLVGKDSDQDNNSILVAARFYGDSTLKR